MGLIVFTGKRRSGAASEFKPDERWLRRGLKSAYLLQPGLWDRNLVTGAIGGSIVGTGVKFSGDKLVTANSTANYALLAHGIATNIALPVSFAVGCVKTAGSVAWSLLRTDASAWNGWFGEGTGISSASAGSFDGSAASVGARSFVGCHANGSDLRSFSPGFGLAVDTSAPSPLSVNTTQVCLGAARRSTVDNAAAAEFTHFFAFQGALDNSALAELAGDYMRLFKPKPIWVPVSAASGPPTLAAIAASDLTASGARLTVT